MNTFDPTAEQLRETTVPEWNTQNALSMHDHGDAGLRLRRDLAIATAEYPRREHVVIDEISGRFTHIPETLWQSLTTGTMGPELRIEASLAGWMRTRFVQPRRRFNPLAIQIPIVSIDSLAAWLAPRTNWLFGLRAVILWITLMLAMVVTMLSRTGHWQDAMVRLPQFVSTFHPLMMIVVFVVTKAVHELAHAVVCRRMGARCGHVGVWILCGFVCPYCDVTDTWRVTDWRKRAAVMAAGIYTELVVASLAVVGWLSTDDISWRLVYVYVLLVCGVSTLVFNANPLMRYDGYHILSDLIASVHLRRDASEAWQRLWFRIVGGPGPERTWHQSKRGWFLIAYHLASSAYRVFVTVAIIALIVSLVERVQLRNMAVLGLMLLAMVTIRKGARSAFKLALGRGVYKSFSPWRRWCVLILVPSVVSLSIFLPWPRFQTLNGRIDAADVTALYPEADGEVQRVEKEFGEYVCQGARLAFIANQQAELEYRKNDSLFRLASLRREIAQRRAIEQPELSSEWDVLQVAESAAQKNLEISQEQVSKQSIISPLAGWVLPQEPRDNQSQRKKIPGSELVPARELHSRVGTAWSGQAVWCRIASTTNRRVVFEVDADERGRLQIGTPVFVHDAANDHKVYRTHVSEISTVHLDESSMTHAAKFQIMCPLGTASENEFLSTVGVTCEGVIHFPRRAIFTDLAEWFTEWARG